MSSNKTTNYRLHRWEAVDDFLREEFNENFSMLDDAARVVYGTYTGDGARSKFIDLGFTPKAVLVVNQEGQMSTGYNMHGGLALPDSPAYHKSGNGQGPIVTIEEGGFQVYTIKISSSYDIYSNQNGGIFHYLSLR